mmetsp:Transcript_60959/g.117468  ORF Transcript_60959/g.117468 Transcript_60959/m.117468 type:complete len:266 (-) Transcript_60959:48-845(-)
MSSWLIVSSQRKFHPGKLLRFVPNTLRKLNIIRNRIEVTRPHVVKILSSRFAQGTVAINSSCQINLGVGAQLNIPCEEVLGHLEGRCFVDKLFCQSRIIFGSYSVSGKVRIDASRMARDRRRLDARSLEASVKLLGEEHVSKLGLAICTPLRIPLRCHKISLHQLFGCPKVRSARYIDYTGKALCTAEEGHQEADQSKVPKMVNAELAFEPILCLQALWYRHDPCVVHEYIDPVSIRLFRVALGERLDALQIGQVKLQEMHIFVA